MTPLMDKPATLDQFRGHSCIIGAEDFVASPMARRTSLAWAQNWAEDQREARICPEQAFGYRLVSVAYQPLSKRQSRQCCSKVVPDPGCMPRTCELGPTSADMPHNLGRVSASLGQKFHDPSAGPTLPLTGLVRPTSKRSRPSLDRPASGRVPLDVAQT